MFNLIFRSTRKSAPNKLFIRNKHKDTHWSVVRKKVHAVDKALDHFDDFYKQVFGSNWLKIREGLLGKQKYVAVINNYSDTEATIAELEKLGALNMRTLFNLEKSYINEALLTKKRIRYLEKVWKMGNELPSVQENSTDPQPSTQKQYSLEASLSNAIIDESRLVDENAIISSAVLGQFLPATKIKGMEDWVPESDHYKYFDKSTNLSVNIEKEYDLHFPEHLNVYCYEEENFSRFDPPKPCLTDVYNYYLMDGGSVLPILALDIKPGNKVLDMCAAPGGKSFLALQTLYPDNVVCNDVSFSRVNRILTVLEEYFYDLEERWIKTNRLRVTQCDGRVMEKDDYDRILVDAPCTNDRISVMENDNNFFKPGRIKERFKLPELQCALLVHALKIVRKGGVVVYSTCSLSPIQNDGVVHMALKQIWEETKMEIVVKDLSSALAQVRSVYRLADQSLLKYGHLLVPCLEQNYGPTYFCKLQKIK